MKYFITIAVVLALLAFTRAQEDANQPEVSDTEQAQSDAESPSSDAEAPPSEEARPPKREGQHHPPRPGTHPICPYHIRPHRNENPQADNENAEGYRHPQRSPVCLG